GVLGGASVVDEIAGDDDEIRSWIERVEVGNGALEEGRRIDAVEQPAALGRDVQIADLCQQHQESCQTTDTKGTLSLARPLRKASSMMQAAARTSAPTFWSNAMAAPMVPPVARRSSRTTTRCPGLMASAWISTVSVPYSRL